LSGFATEARRSRRTAPDPGEQDQTMMTTFVKTALAVCTAALTGGWAADPDAPRRQRLDESWWRPPRQAFALVWTLRYLPIASGGRTCAATTAVAQTRLAEARPAPQRLHPAAHPAVVACRPRGGAGAGAVRRMDVVRHRGERRAVAAQPVDDRTELGECG
jgi:hypothetical protein